MSTNNNDDNNTGVPIALHIFTTLIVLIVFGAALEQSCSLSIRHRLFKIRIGVLLSNAILCILSIVLNFDLLRTSNQISFLDTNFVLIVRTLQIIWLFVAYFIGYYFVTYSIKALYSLSSSPSPNSKKQRAPDWMSRFWLILTVIQEIVLSLCYIIALATQSISFIHFVWITAFGFCVIGGLLVIFALVDIRKYVLDKTRNSDGINIKSLQKLKRLMLIQMIICIIVIAASLLNFVVLIQHLFVVGINRPNTLNSTAIDNVTGYLTYFVILIGIEILFIYWTLRINNVNYCLFCCGGWRKYSNNEKFKVDRSTMCYAFCRNGIDFAEEQRQKIIKLKASENQSQQPLQLRASSAAAPRQSLFSITNMVPSSASPPMPTANKEFIDIILFDFDGVLTNKDHRYFEHWTDYDLQTLTKTSLKTTFGDDARINELMLHFEFLTANNVKIYCIANETSKKVLAIFEKLGFDKYFDKDTIIGSDHHLIEEYEANSKIKLFILKLIQQANIQNAQTLLYLLSMKRMFLILQILICVKPI